MNDGVVYTKREEFFNSISHAVGSFLAIVGTVAMIVLAKSANSLIMVISALIYGLSMIIMYTMSTLYHALKSKRTKSILRIFDHASIYLLIAGCYTPLTLVILEGSGRALFLLAGVWVAAILGIILNAIDVTRFRKVSMALYLLMGWSVVLEMGRVIPLLGIGGTSLLIAGGVAYSVGVIFYKMKKVPYMHGIWHLFVLAGSILHYICFLRYYIAA